MEDIAALCKNSVNAVLLENQMGAFLTQQQVFIKDVLYGLFGSISFGEHDEETLCDHHTTLPTCFPVVYKGNRCNQQRTSRHYQQTVSAKECKQSSTDRSNCSSKDSTNEVQLEEVNSF